MVTAEGAMSLPHPQGQVLRYPILVLKYRYRSRYLNVRLREVPSQWELEHGSDTRI
jgi:hypothetical protein